MACRCDNPVVDWAPVLTVMVSILTVASLVLGFFARMVGNQISGSINKFRIEVVNELETRLARVEQRLSDIQVNTRRR